MRFCVEMSGQQVLVHVNFMDEDDGRGTRLVPFASGDGWRMIDGSGQCIGITVRIGDTRKAHDLGAAFANEIRSACNSPESTEAINRMRDLFSRIQQFELGVARAA